jgi:hypothetical protein
MVGRLRKDVRRMQEATVRVDPANDRLRCARGKALLDARDSREVIELPPVRKAQEKAIRLASEWAWSRCAAMGCCLSTVSVGRDIVPRRSPIKLRRDLDCCGDGWRDGSLIR